MLKWLLHTDFGYYRVHRTVNPSTEDCNLVKWDAANDFVSCIFAFECIDRLCKGRWHSTVKSMLKLSQLWAFFDYCCAARETVLSSVSGLIPCYLLKNWSYTKLVVKSFEWLRSCWMIDFKVPQGSMITKSGARISILNLKPGRAGVSSTNFLCSAWVLRRHSLI